MNYKLILYYNIIIASLLISSKSIGQDNSNGKLTGNIQLDSTWSSTIYLSYIRDFGELHSMSSKMILAESKIDSLGHFEFDLSYLPEEKNIFRLHIAKKLDSKNSIIIGGNHENYLIFIANRNSEINLKTTQAKPPFKKVDFGTNKENVNFQKITNLVFKQDSIASVSGASKRKFIEDKLIKNLLRDNQLTSLYALYKSAFESNYSRHKKFYKSYLKKWSDTDNNYFRDFKNKLPIKKEKKSTKTATFFIYAMLLLSGFILGKVNLPRSNRIKKLSVQERKIYDLLRKGATNKEIAEEFNIGISTTKTHVSNILSKLKVKSRKDIMNLK
ncbi:response regulator transcription factor [Mesonia maritima]|uniref:DNA-binding CsgD family transcriptional regulator n=1 Tax=Mesonia maritima TaxID=1793873 RepID=A0ABU1K3G9_9FLAO|nr:LuxR C-terminal-related transcriptional regulator [Mesonia maritima]MDR6300144.1 DNA-binding CsgD family transcriptional regulator [Mesonia maritima]